MTDALAYPLPSRPGAGGAEGEGGRVLWSLRRCLESNQRLRKFLRQQIAETDAALVENRDKQVNLSAAVCVFPPPLPPPSLTHVFDR